MLFGSTRELSSRQPVGQYDYGATPIQTSNFSCTEPNAYISNTLNKLIFTQSSARFLFLSCVHSLFGTVGTKWREEREEMGSCFFESTKYTLMWINHFCMRCSVFENDESVLKRVGKLAVRWRTASHAFERK